VASGTRIRIEVREENKVREWPLLHDFLRTIVSVCSASSIALPLLLNFAEAADLPTPVPGAPAEGPEAFPHWFVRFGALGLVAQSWSRLYAQPLAEVAVPGVGLVPIGGVGPQLLLPGSNAKYSDIFSAAIELGYFVTPNWSVEMEVGFPLWQTVEITGFSPGAPPAGTTLFHALPATVPLTAVYHFTQFGAFQPYVGAGIAPIFVLAVRDSFNTDVSVDPTVGAALQTGFDYMINPRWGVFFDVKKLFAHFDVKSTGINVGLPVGVIPVSASSATTAQPWLFSAGVTYRF
jgi:outer membrane protein